MRPVANTFCVILSDSGKYVQKGGVKLNTGKNTKLQFLQLLFSQVNGTGKGGKIECDFRNAPKKITSFKMYLNINI